MRRFPLTERRRVNAAHTTTPVSTPISRPVSSAASGILRDCSTWCRRRWPPVPLPAPTARSPATPGTATHPPRPLSCSANHRHRRRSHRCHRPVKIEETPTGLTLRVPLSHDTTRDRDHSRRRSSRFAKPVNRHTSTHLRYILRYTFHRRVIVCVSLLGHRGSSRGQQYRPVASLMLARFGFRLTID